jgi:hypothetical protein
MRRMPQFYVEGVFVTRQGVRKWGKTATYQASSIEPYAKSIWANNPKEAAQIATEELAGGEWIEGPRITQVTEEQRMRSMGAPEFPGLSPANLKPHKR